MKTNTPNKERRSIYWMLVRADEKARPFFEVTLYTLMAVCAVAAILQFAEQRDPLPLTSVPITFPAA